MARNHEVTKAGPLLNEAGELCEPGWSRHMLQRYKRGDIKAPAWRIKEWDYYLIMAQDFALALTLSDDGYVGLQSCSLLKFGKQPWEHTETVLTAFPMGRLRMPESSAEGVSEYRDARLHMRFEVLKGARHLTCRFDNFEKGRTLEADILLAQPDMESMVIATPWDRKHAFYYNQKINGMRAQGSVRYDGEEYVFHPETDFGTLDWGRGVWTYDNTWYWGSGNMDMDGHHFGFNIGYGFGNTKAATENVLFYDGRVHKLDDITFHIPEDSYMKPWTFTSSDGRFEMDFEPVLDRAAKIDFKAIVSDQHQVFGRMRGRAVLDDGTALDVRDMLCFAEKVHNRY